MTTLSMKKLVKRQRGRPPMKKQNRRTMQIRLSIDEQTLMLDSLELVRERMERVDEDLRIIDVLIERTAALK